MNDLLGKLLSAVFTPLLLMLLFMTPALGLTAYIPRKKRQMKEQSEDPFTDTGLRPPGESLRLKIDELVEKQQDMLLFQIALATMLALAAAFSPSHSRITMCRSTASTSTTC
ncbi:MAG TPA: hypothetical protein VHF69_11500 [Candidatus Synoicihabitans sp.]|nr:hypothetical protein [Candidatus Synoicihabitans sp.]